MDRLFTNPLVVAETVVGSLIDQRAVVLYQQPDFEQDKNDLESRLLNALSSAASGTFLAPTVEDFVAKRKLVELFTGVGIPVLSSINGFNMWGVTYQAASLEISSDMCEHPIENGTVITDASVLRPITAEVGLIMPTALYTKIYRTIQEYYENKKKIQMLTKFGLIKNMVISSMPYKLDASNVDRPTINITLHQISEVEAQYRQYEGSLNNLIEQDKSRQFDDTSSVNVGRLYTDTVSDVLAEGQ